jgi:hypothetical protein
MVIAQSEGKGDTLCNVYLHRLDRQWQARGYGILVRYADLCGSPHRSAYAESRVMPSGDCDRLRCAGSRVSSSA